MNRLALLVGMTLVVMGLTACTPKQPDNRKNICEVFRQYPSWYWNAKKSQDKWGVPINVQMAIIYQESRFNAKAKPERGKILWVIPWKRPSTAYGYSQALNQTWDHYQKENGYSKRTSFADATNFIGWYGNMANRKAGIAKNDAYALYLAYHEGIGGYQRGTYLKKQWLINVSKKVQSRANIYQGQLRACESKIKKPWWKLF